MKKVFTLICLAVFFVACKQSVKGANGVTYTSPIQYNDYIIERQTKVARGIINFSQIVQQGDFDKALNSLGEQASDATRALEEIKGMPEYNDNAAFRDAAINSFVFYKRILEEDYRQLVEMRKQKAEETEEGQTQMQQIIDKLSADEQKLDEAFKKEQTKFSKENKMRLTDNAIQKEIDQ